MQLSCRQRNLRRDGGSAFHQHGDAQRVWNQSQRDCHHDGSLSSKSQTKNDISIVDHLQSCTPPLRRPLSPDSSRKALPIPASKIQNKRESPPRFIRPPSTSSFVDYGLLSKKTKNTFEVKSTHAGVLHGGVGNMILKNTDSIFCKFPLKNEKGEKMQGKESLKYAIEIGNIIL